MSRILKNIGLFWVPILNEALEVILGLLGYGLQCQVFLGVDNLALTEVGSDGKQNRSWHYIRAT